MCVCYSPAYSRKKGACTVFTASSFRCCSSYVRSQDDELRYNATDQSRALRRDHARAAQHMCLPACVFPLTKRHIAVNPGTDPETVFGRMGNASVDADSMVVSSETTDHKSRS